MEGKWGRYSGNYCGLLLKSIKKSVEAKGLTKREKVQQMIEEKNNKPGSQITEEKVRTSVFSMYPRVDGLNPTFFQIYWNIVEVDVTLL